MGREEREAGTYCIAARLTSPCCGVILRVIPAFLGVIMAKVETVVIDRGGEPVIINKADMQPDDVLYGKKPKPVKKKVAVKRKVSE